MWGVAQEYLDYRSFLNNDLAPRPTLPTPGMYAWHKSRYMDSLNIRPGDHRRPGLIQRALSVTYAEGSAAPEESARLELLSRPQSVASNFGFIIIEGGVDSLALDNMYMKNVIMRNTDVFYDGGLTVLENVYFVNCRFHLGQTPTAAEFGKKVLSSPSVSFRTRP